MNEILNHYQLNYLLKELLFNTFSFIKNNTSNKNNTKILTLTLNNKDYKKEKELYEKYLKYINSKIDKNLDTR